MLGEPWRNKGIAGEHVLCRAGGLLQHRSVVRRRLVRARIAAQLHEQDVCERIVELPRVELYSMSDALPVRPVDSVGKGVLDIEHLGDRALSAVHKNRIGKVW